MANKPRNRRKRSSIVYDVKTSLDAIDMIGQSKKEVRKEKIKGIHSLKQKDNSMSDCQNFAKWVRENHGVMNLKDVTEEHYRAYFVHLDNKGVSKGHKINVETSLRLLEEGYKKVSAGSKSDFKGFCTEKRLYTLGRDEALRNRCYERSEVEAIKENVSPEVAKAIDLMSELGLRVKESVNVRVEHFVQTEDGLRLVIPQNGGAGITKGGRFRDVPVQERFVEPLQRFLEGKEPTDKLVAVSYATVRKAVHRACKTAGIKQDGRGCHGFRHTYARERFKEFATVEQKAMMDRILENRAIGRKADYGIGEWNRALFESTRNIMNQVHSELGHGENRWRLAMVYLKD